MAVGKDVHRNKGQALTMTMLTHSPYATVIVRVRRYTIVLNSGIQ